MTTAEKIKRTLLIALGFGLSMYLIMSGVTILNKEEVPHKDVENATSVAFECGM